MRFVRFRWGGHPTRRCAPHRNALKLECLEDRVVPDTVTFAQFIHLGESPQVFAYTSNGGTSADFSTRPGGDPILLSFDPRFAPDLTGPRTAHLFLSSHTSTPTAAPLPNDDLTREHFAATTNTLQIVLDTPVRSRNNFLTVQYTDILSGRIGSHEASLRASDAAAGTPPDQVTFSSDFINFTGTINHGFSLSFSSVDSSDGSGGLQQGAGSFFKSFTAAGTGTFDTNFSGGLAGTKFQDTNGNGVRDPSEPGLAGWVIVLDSADGRTHLTTVTDASGNYSFNNLDPGTYRVHEASQAGWVQTTVNPGAITLVSGVTFPGVDFGNFRLGAIAGTKFQDTNGNGVRDPGEPGLQGWTILLDSLDDRTHLSTVTDADGNFSFVNLFPGIYRIREQGQPGWVQITVNPGDVTVVSGSSITGLNFGNFQPGSISGTKFQDSNGNGVRDSGEPGLQGWTIVLESLDGSNQLRTVTDANGNFSFTNLKAGTYRIREEGQPGWVQITVNPGDVTVISGSSVTGVNFGNFQPGSITGTKFEDSDGNGMRAPGEPGLQGWTIVLDAVGGSTHLSTVTDADGNFSFGNLNPGLYQIHEVAQQGWVQTTVNPGTKTIVSGSRVTGVDFGNRMTGIGPVIAPPTGPPTGPPAIPTLISKLLLFAPNLLGLLNGQLAADTAYVGGLYQNLLNRPADPGGLSHWVDLLLAGVTRQQVATALWQSPEHRGVEVDQLYSRLLGRAADPGGRTTWINAFLSGASERDVIQGFLLSSEFQAAHDTDVAFVNALYSDILARLGEPVGVSAKLQALQTGFSRQALAQAVVTSPEADKLVVDQFYVVFLDRSPDPGGERQWTDLLVRGQASFESVAEAILASDEYFARASKA